MSPLKSSLARSVGKFLSVYRNDDLSLRGLSQESRETFVITGGTKTSYTGYTVHTFLSPGTLRVVGAPPSFACDILVVGGGGAGGSGVTGAYEAGGGGAGGMRVFPNHPVGGGSFTVTVGDGGSGDPSYANAMGNFSNIAFPSPLRAEGGGAGGQHDIAGSGWGASGGGCRRSGSPGGENRVAGPGWQGNPPVPASVPVQGNAGGNGLNSSVNSAGGGGGGAGGAGSNYAGNNDGGDGGAGLQNNYRTGSNQFYAAGGGGVGYSQTTGPVGGSSIGGNGGSSGTAGATNTGSGGGAGAGGSSPGVGGDGGPGIVVLRYAD